MEKNRKKSIVKTVLILAAAVFTLLVVIPFPSRIKDGGSLYLSPFIPVYDITKWNGYGKDEHHRTAGITVRIFGMEVVNTFREVER